MTEDYDEICRLIALPPLPRLSWQAKRVKTSSPAAELSFVYRREAVYTKLLLGL